MDAPHYVSRSLISLWYEHGPRTMDLPIAFAIIRYNKTNERRYLLAAAMPLHTLVRNKQVKEQSPEQIAAHLDFLKVALEPFRNTNWFAMIKPKDPWWAIIRPYYEFYAPIVPDPVNSIDLRAFAFDSQSVHRASVQTAMEASLNKLRAVPLPEDMDALEEYLVIDNDLISEPEVQISAAAYGAGLHKKDLNPYTLIHDYTTLTISLTSGPVSYGNTFNHLWAYIRNHEHKEELVKRLTEELGDSLDVCANGKLARLLNVVEGYMEGVSTTSSKELFQNRMAIVAKMEPSERLTEATKAFQEFGIPEGERGAWMEALED
jgi:predicted house-cleaning noncanonical NTP pyrophosphatase (MazG superfamily)